MKKLVSDIAKAKNLGSSRSGVSHWIWQRLSALFLIPLYVWFIYVLLCFFSNPEYAINEILYSPFHVVALLFLVNLSLFHSAIGMKVVLEDYVHNECRKNFYIILTYAVMAVTMVVTSFTLILNFIVNI